MNFGLLTIWSNSPFFFQIYHFHVLKNVPIFEIFHRGGYCSLGQFFIKFWSIFSLNCHNYFNQKLILLHLSAWYSYNYHFLVTQILAFIFDQKTSLLFAHKITYITSRTCHYKIMVPYFIIQLINNMHGYYFLVKMVLLLKGKKNWKFGILTHFLQRHQNMVHQFRVFHHIVHDQLYIQNGTICVQLCLYFVCTSIFLHSPFSPSTLRCTIDMHFKAFHYYTFAHTFLTQKYQFWVTNYVEKWCSVTHLSHICRTKKSPLFDNFHRGGVYRFWSIFHKIFGPFFGHHVQNYPILPRNNGAFWCRGFLRLCFENFNFLAVFGQGKTWGNCSFTYTFITVVVTYIYSLWPEIYVSGICGPLGPFY